MKNLETIINTGEDAALYIETELVNHFWVFSHEVLDAQTFPRIF